MSSGAVQVAPRLCCVGGCQSPIRARSRCAKHYQRWQVANPDVPDNNAQERETSRRAVFGALPGRLDEIAAETGLALATVRRHIKQLRAANKVRISTFDSPQVTGKRWAAVWAKGWGSDAILTKEMLTDYVNAKQRRNDKRLNQRRAQHGWIASLGRLPSHRESDMQ